MKIVVGMSGGVDSSLAAALLKEQGHSVIGLFMRNWHESDDSGICTTEADFQDVKSVCSKLDIPYYSVDFSHEYMERVFKLFLYEYERGRTPNPDVLCNKEIKFDAFIEYAKRLGADAIATGHYCSTDKIDGKTWLTRAADENKDQTYFLNQVTSAQLERIIFPLGGLKKPEVRLMATKYGLPTAKKKDSTGICFIGERNFRDFLAKYIPMKDGDIKTLDGKTVGKHCGVYYYTVGQRKGLGIGGGHGGSGEPWFVVSKDVKNNVLYVCEGEQDVLYSKSLTVEKLNFIAERKKEPEFDCLARIRHRQPLQKARAYVLKDGGVKLVFEIPQRAVAEGQYAVLYDGRYCLGGGVIQAKSQKEF